MLRIILSRTDSIGDVILSLPMAGYIKEKYPDAVIYFLGKTYTQSIIESCKHVDHFLNWDVLKEDPNNIATLKALNLDTIIHVFPNKDVAKLAFKAKIPNRIGTLGRLPHLLYCNKRPYFTRKKSDLHEAQLNLKLLKPLGINADKSLKDVTNHLSFVSEFQLDDKWTALLKKDKTNVILHPKSQGSAIEWGLDKFTELIHLLPADQYHIFITGTKAEAKLIGDNLPFNQENVTSLLGQMTLDELIAFIGKSDAIVAASTGPLHIGAALGIKAIGLYSNRRPIHPGRWKPIGNQATALVYDTNCKNCQDGKLCLCINNIKPQSVWDAIKK